MKSIVKLASILIIATAAGCSSIDVNTDGGQGLAQHEDFNQVLAASSQGK